MKKEQQNFKSLAGEMGMLQETTLGKVKGGISVIKPISLGYSGANAILACLNISDCGAGTNAAPCENFST